MSLHANSNQRRGKDSPNLFARGGQREPPQQTVEPEATTRENPPEIADTNEVMDGPSLIRAIEKRREVQPRAVALSEQLDAIIEFTATRCNIAKDLKQGLLLLRETARDVRRERDELEEAAAAATKERDELRVRLLEAEAKSDKKSKKPVQKDDSTPAGSSKSAKRTRQPSGDGTPEGSKKGSKKRLLGKSPKGSAVAVAVSAPTQGGKTGQPSENPWVLVERQKSKKKVRDRTEKENKQRKDGPRYKWARRRKKGEALILTTEESKYPEVIRSMRAESELKDLGAAVRDVRRTRTGEVILQLKRDTGRNCSTYKEMVEKVLGEGVKVRAITTEVTLQIKNLDEVTEESEVARALLEQCQVSVATEAVRRRKGPQGTQVATVRVQEADAKKVLKVGKLKIGWSICPTSIPHRPEVCFRCYEYGHKSWSCQGPDRTNVCRRCSEAGHKARDCKRPLKCAVCSGKPNDKHAMGGPMCPAFKPATTGKA